MLDFVGDKIFQRLIVLISQAVHLWPITNRSKELGVGFKHKNSRNSHRQNDKDERWDESVKKRELFRRFGMMRFAGIPIDIAVDCWLERNDSVADERCLRSIESINVIHFRIVWLAVISIEMLSRFMVSTIFFGNRFERRNSVVIKEYRRLICKLTQWLWQVRSRKTVVACGDWRDYQLDIDLINFKLAKIRKTHEDQSGPADWMVSLAHCSLSASSGLSFPSFAAAVIGDSLIKSLFLFVPNNGTLSVRRIRRQSQLMRSGHLASYKLEEQAMKLNDFFSQLHWPTWKTAFARWHISKRTDTSLPMGTWTQPYAFSLLGPRCTSNGW